VHDPIARVDQIGGCRVYNSSLKLNILEI